MKHTIDRFLLLNRALYLSKQRNCPVDCVSRADDSDVNVFPPRSVSFAVRAKRSKPRSGINASLLVSKKKLWLGEIRASESIRALRQ